MNTVNMAKNPIQEQRIKKYFLEATKEILIGEGIASLSVRNVAEKAGYSYATLYNYFKSLSDLISCSILDFQQDCEEYIKEKTVGIDPGKQKIKSITRAYVNYFVQYPGLFNLFYIESLSSPEVGKSAVLFLDNICQEPWDYCVANKIYTREEVKESQEKLRYAISGILLIYLNRNYPAKHQEFIDQLEKQLNAIFK